MTLYGRMTGGGQHAFNDCARAVLQFREIAVRPSSCTGHRVRGAHPNFVDSAFMSASEDTRTSSAGTWADHVVFYDNPYLAAHTEQEERDWVNLLKVPSVSSLMSQPV